MTGGAGYAQRHLEHSDYYDEGRRVQGEWHGQGAELLGLRGEVTREQFEAVREGLHPDTGESSALATVLTALMQMEANRAKAGPCTI